MRSLIRIIPVVAVALMIFSLPAFAVDGTSIEIVTNGGNGGFSCFPFICG